MAALTFGGAGLVVALAVAVFGGEGPAPHDPPPAGAAASAVAPAAHPGQDPDAGQAAAGTAEAPRGSAPANPLVQRPAANSGPQRPPTAAIASAGPAPPPSGPAPEVLVRFGAAHPLGRAHALRGAGDRAGAEALVRDLVPRRPELRGLCFVRFTAGGYEVVFAVCPPPAGADRARLAAQALARLRAARGVEFAEENAVVDVE